MTDSLAIVLAGGGERLVAWHTACSLGSAARTTRGAASAPSRCSTRASPSGSWTPSAAAAATGWPPSLRIAAVDAERGERIAFTAASGVPLERAVAASRAIPSLQPPVPVGGRRCIDGAIGSATNADLALAVPARTVLVVTGVGARPEPGTPEPLWAAALDREVAALEASGRRVIVLRPSAADRAAMGADPMSGAGAPAAVAAGIAAGRRVAASTRAAA